MNEHPQPPRLLTVRQFAESHEWPSQAALRNLIFHRKTNGFHSVVLRVGRRILLDEQKFFEWVRSSQSTPVKGGRHA